MKYLWLIIILPIVGCGTYIGTEGLIYLANGLPEGYEGVTIVSPEVIKPLVGGLTALLGPYAWVATLIPGFATILSSIFITKRKKKGL